MANQPKNKKTESKKTTEVGPRQPLLRSKNDRVLWGVAGGLAEHIGFNATLVRIAFVVTSLFGGAGILAYLVLAVALPEDDGTGKPVPESVWARLGKVFVVCLLVAIGLAVAAFLAAVSAWTTATGHGGIVAAVVIALGHRAGRVRLRPGVAPPQHPAAAHHGAGARHSRRGDRRRRHRHRRIDRPADLHADRGGGPAGRRLQAGHRPAGGRSPGAALAEGQDHHGLVPPRHRPDDRLGPEERLRRRSCDRQGGRAGGGRRGQLTGSIPTSRWGPRPPMPRGSTSAPTSSSGR